MKNTVYLIRLTFPDLSTGYVADFAVDSDAIEYAKSLTLRYNKEVLILVTTTSGSIRLYRGKRG